MIGRGQQGRCTLYAHINSLSSSSTQSQAGQAEAQIRAEFDSLRLVLDKEEAWRLQALATEEEQKVSAVQQLIENTNSDIIALKQLIESVKREIGNEDLALLQVNVLLITLKLLFLKDFWHLAYLKMYCLCFSELPEIKKEVSVCCN